MECFTEFDELQEALKRVHMDEEVMPYYRGRLVENEECYSKIQKLLNAPQMQNSHRYLYDLDVENLTEDEIAKVNELFDLGVKKGFIDNSFEEEFEKEENPTAVVADEEPDVVQIAVKEPSAPVPCWTILYSATKNGETKCGECYSNAISVSAAKADCLAKLSRFGYDNVSVLAIEAGDPDCAGKGCCNEDDLLKGRKHNAHKDELNEDETESDDESIDEASGNPYAAGMKVVTGGKVSNVASKKKAKCVKEDDGEAEDSVEDDANDSAEDATDDSDDSDDSGSDSDSDSGEEDTSDDAGSDDEAADDAEGDSADDAEGDSADDADDADDGESEDSEEGSDEDSDENSDDEPAEELDDDKKAQLKDEYRRVFKETMLKCGFEDKSFNDLSIDDKVKFFEAIKEKWTKNDPTEFFSTKEADQLDAVVVTK